MAAATNDVERKHYLLRQVRPLLKAQHSDKIFDLCTFFPWLASNDEVQQLVEDRLSAPDVGTRRHAARILAIAGSDLGIRHVVLNALSVHPQLEIDQTGHENQAASKVALLRYAREVPAEWLGAVCDEFHKPSGNLYLEYLASQRVEIVKIAVETIEPTTAVAMAACAYLRTVGLGESFSGSYLEESLGRREFVQLALRAAASDSSLGDSAYAEVQSAVESWASALAADVRAAWMRRTHVERCRRRFVTEAVEGLSAWSALAELFSQVGLDGDDAWSNQLGERRLQDSPLFVDRLYGRPFETPNLASMLTDVVPGGLWEELSIRQRAAIGGLSRERRGLMVGLVGVDIDGAKEFDGEVVRKVHRLGVDVSGLATKEAFDEAAMRVFREPWRLRSTSLLKSLTSVNWEDERLLH